MELHVNLLIFLNNKRKFILKTKSKMMNTPDIFYNFFDHKDSAWSFQITNLGNIECVNFNSEMYLLLINLSYKTFRKELILPTGTLNTGYLRYNVPRYSVKSFIT